MHCMYSLKLKGSAKGACARSNLDEAPRGMKKILKHFLRYLTALRVGENKRNSNNNLDLPFQAVVQVLDIPGVITGTVLFYFRNTVLRRQKCDVSCDHILARKRPLTPSAGVPVILLFLTRSFEEFEKKSCSSETFGFFSNKLSLERGISSCFSSLISSFQRATAR